MPGPHADAAPRIFTPEYYARMRALEAGSWWNAAMRDVAARLLETARLAPTGVMLDIGCGSGQTMAWFADRHSRWRVVGLDVSADGLRAARILGTTTVLQASALHLPVPTRSVDLVITLDVLQHLPLEDGDLEALSEIARVLRPGGHLLVRTNAQAFPHTSDDPVHQFRKYRQADLRRKIERAGFGVLRIGRLNAVLGLAEIPRELRARNGEHAYHGLLSEPRVEAAWPSALKRAWLRFEGWTLRKGMSWPQGRTTLALCRRLETP